MKTFIFIVVLLSIAGFGYWYFYVRQDTTVPAADSALSTSTVTKPLPSLGLAKAGGLSSVVTNSTLSGKVIQS